MKHGDSSTMRFVKVPARVKSQTERDDIWIAEVAERRVSDFRRADQTTRRHALMDTARTLDYLPNRESVRHAVDGRIVVTPPPGFGDAWAGG